MNYSEALRIVEKNQHLLGKKFKGATIDELIIYPLNTSSKEKFLKNYLQTLNYKKSISDFLSEKEFHIAIVIDKKRMDSMGWYSIIDIEEVKEAIL